MPRYVPPYDQEEKHYPGFNYCGPGTNVWRRMTNKVRPMDDLDAACYTHDIATEPRGPYTSQGDGSKLRSADRTLRDKALKLSMPWSNYPKKSAAVSVAAAMELLLTTGARGRGLKD
ncbi:MAG: hypothetical protein [Circular genetic element sp.]|nr:MAG: hypothetical protein [Circular genetic element sp.]